MHEHKHKYTHPTQMYSEPFNLFEFYFYLVEFTYIRQLQTRFLQICAPLYVSVTLIEKVRPTHIGRHTLPSLNYWCTLKKRFKNNVP